MPIFEYLCRRCEHVTSFLEKLGTAGPHKCEQCGSTDTEKAFSTFAARMGPARGEPAACANAGSCTSGTCPLRGG